MKEATGELNITLVIVVGISILVAFFYFVIWPGLDANFKANSKCSRAICENPCGEGSGKNTCPGFDEKMATCYTEQDWNTKSNPFSCPWKG